MAMRFMDSFDHYTSTERLKKYDYMNNGPAIVAGVGRNGTAGMQSVAQNGGNNNIGITFDNQPTWIVGFSVELDGWPTAQTSLVRIRDGALSGTEQMSVEVTTLGHLAVARGGTIIATGPSVLSLSVAHHIQFKTTINNTTGSYELRFNSVTELSASGTDTQQSGNAFANSIELGKDGGSAVWNFDDFWICDGVDSGVSGAPNNDFLGDLRIQYRAPSGNGNSSGMTGSDGNSTDNYLLVDESAPNGDTDYVAGDSVGDKDTYAIQDLTPTAGTVYGVQVLSWARKTDAGARSICNVVRSASVEEDSPDYSLAIDYDYYRDLRQDDPSNNQWTISAVNAMEAGTKVTV